MNRVVPGLVVGMLGGILVLAMFFVPTTGGAANNGPVVTADMKRLEAGLSRLKRQTETSRGNETQGLRNELASLERNWLGLKEGLTVRGLEGAPSSLAFEQAVAEMKSAMEQGKEVSGAGSRSLDWGSIYDLGGKIMTSFAQVKANLVGTTVLEVWRLAFTLGALSLLWVSLVVAIHGLSDRLSLKQ